MRLSTAPAFLLATSTMMASTAAALAGISARSQSCTSSRSSSASSLGAAALRTIAKHAARSDTARTLDVHGVAWLEHVNLVVGSKVHAEAFYRDFLGLSDDIGSSFHLNLGQQQVHLAAKADEPAQRVTGSVGLVVPKLDAVRERLDAAAEALGGTEFGVIRDDVDNENDDDDDDNGGGCMTVSCPWGNTVHLYCAARDDAKLIPTKLDSPHKMVKLHAEGGSYSPDRIAVRGQPGIRYVEIAVRVGTVPRIARFYEEVLGCTTTTSRPPPSEEGGQRVVAVAVSVGPGVHLIFVESSATLTDDDRAAMEGVHICVYAHDFRALYDRLSERGLIWTNPRFVHLDSCETWEEAAASRTLRFKDVVDVDSGEKLVELEHETRPLRHGQYMKVPFYSPK